MDSTTTINQIERFADCIFEPGDIVELRPLPHGERSWHLASALAGEVPRLARLNRTGQNIYIGANPRKRIGGGKAEDVALARCLFVDFDGPAPSEALERIRAAGLPEPTITISSGHGVHNYWRLAEPLADLARWRQLQKRLIAMLASDKNIHDPARVMRLPGFLNVKAEPIPCRIVEADPARRYDLAEMLDAMEQQVAAPEQAAPAAADDGTIPDGKRNSTLASIGGSLRRSGLSAAEIAAALNSINQKRCQPPLPHSEVESIAASVGRYTPGGAAAPWPDPQPLPGLAEVMQFDDGLLPDALRPWVADIAERMQCPPDFPAVASVIVLATLVGRKVGIRPKRRDDWLVVPNLWGAVVGPPSVMKTPALKEPMRMLQRLEMVAKEKYEQEHALHLASVLVAEERRKDRSQAIRNAIKSGGDPIGVAQSWLESEGDMPARRRYVTNDVTVEKLAALMNENPQGILAFRDELVGLLRNLDKPGQEGARAFFLEAWNGDGRYIVDRIIRGTTDVEACCLSILGGIQPGPLSDYLRDAAKGGRGDDGLLQRFQLLVWPDISSDWRNVDRWPDTDAKTAAWEMYQRLDALDGGAVGAPDPDGGIPFCRFGGVAQEMFDDWRGTLERRLRSGDEQPCLVAHLAKYRSLIPSLALLTHLADGDGPEVSGTALQRALGWGRYLETHARRMYGASTASGSRSAGLLAQRILAGDVRDGFTLRDVYDRHWSGLDNRDEVKEAAEALCDLDWLRPEEVPTDGRTKRQYRISPKLGIGSAEEGRKRRKSPSKPPSAPFAPPCEASDFDFDAINATLAEVAESEVA